MLKKVLIFLPIIERENLFSIKLEIQIIVPSSKNAMAPIPYLLTSLSI
jgi:hypothetical protein